MGAIISLRAPNADSGRLSNRITANTLWRRQTAGMLAGKQYVDTSTVTYT
jgi:hypothetical protein